jgi:hypothetical protein
MMVSTNSPTSPPVSPSPSSPTGFSTTAPNTPHSFDTTQPSLSDLLQSLMHLPTPNERAQMPLQMQQLCARVEQLQIAHQQVLLRQLQLLNYQYGLTNNVPATPIQSPADINPVVLANFQNLQCLQLQKALEMVRNMGVDASDAGLAANENYSANSNGGKRLKSYSAPKGVWKNNGGYNATIYVHKRRIYGPIRKELGDAIEDRKEMESELRHLLQKYSNTNTPGNSSGQSVIELEMRDMVGKLRTKTRQLSSQTDHEHVHEGSSAQQQHQSYEHQVKRQRTMSEPTSGLLASPLPTSPCLQWGKIDFSNDHFILNNASKWGSSDDEMLNGGNVMIKQEIGNEIDWLGWTGGI